MSDRTIEQHEHENLELELEKALVECARLQEENARLKALLNLPIEGTEIIPIDYEPEPAIQGAAETGVITNSSPAASKITLYRSLFRGREDVYPVRWEGYEKRLRGYNAIGYKVHGKENV